MKRFTIALTLLAALALVVGIASNIAADPRDLQLVESSDWLTALQDGQISPVRDWDQVLEGLHPGEGETFRMPTLYVMESVPETGLDAGLVMAWGDPTPIPPESKVVTAAWEWVLPVDPDLTNQCITLTAWPRMGMNSISFSLKDAKNVMKGWLWPVGNAPGQLPPNAATTLTIRAAGVLGEAGSTGYWDGGVDLTQVASLEFDESGVQQGGIPLPAPLVGFVGQWNYWHDIIVKPCVTPPLDVTIDIKPGSYPNAVNPRSKGVIPVAVLTTVAADGTVFDATQVDPATVAFGRDGAPEVHNKGHIEDIDRDGDLDIVLHFDIQLSGIACGDTETALTGMTYAGLRFVGRDSIKTVCK